MIIASGSYNQHVTMTPQTVAPLVTPVEMGVGSLEYSMANIRKGYS